MRNCSCFVTDNVAKDAYPSFVGMPQYEVIMGSHAYGVATEESDLDIYGFAIPQRQYIYPEGLIHGFDKIPEFGQFDKQTEIADYNIYNIVKYFKLCMGCNPNMLDSLFVPDDCVLMVSPVGQYVREHNYMFLSKLAHTTYTGYAHSQLKKIKNKKPQGKRIALVEKHGYDVKHAYHLVRLLLEADDLFTNGTLTLNKHSERLREVREGKWTLEQLESFSESMLVTLEKLKDASSLPDAPREKEIRWLLETCLEKYYGT